RSRPRAGPLPYHGERRHARVSHYRHGCQFNPGTSTETSRRARFRSHDKNGRFNAHGPGSGSESQHLRPDPDRGFEGGLMEPVVITGLGVCSTYGRTAPELWGKIINDGAVRLEEPSTLPDESNSQISQAQAMAETASIEALKDAGLWDIEQLTGVDTKRFGCTFSASKPLFIGKGAEVVPPESLHHVLRKRFDFQGESRNVVAACATGAYAAAMGASWIEHGLCDVVLAGSVEPPAHPLIAAWFKRMGVVSKESRMRPFDRN